MKWLVGLAFCILSFGLMAQDSELKAITLLSANGQVKEFYHVAKTDTTLKNGSYQYYFNDHLLFEGFYKNNKRDSTWKFYRYDLQLSHTGNFKNDSAIGAWKYYDTDPKEIFNGNIKIIYESDTDGSDPCYVNNNDSIHFTPVEYSVEFPGGMKSMAQFILINTTLEYPFKGEIVGKVYVGFIIDEFGFPKDFKILRGVNQNIDGLILERIKELPPFIPLVDCRKPRKTKYTIPVTLHPR